MNTFSLHLHGVTQYEHLPNVISFIGEDASGKFGIMAKHCRMLSSIKFGLSTLYYADNRVEYLALAGGIVYFLDNSLYIGTRQYYRSHNYEEIVTVLNKQLHAEAETIRDINETLRRFDEMVLRHLWEMEQTGKL